MKRTWALLVPMLWQSKLINHMNVTAFGVGSSSDFLYLTHWNSLHHLPKIDCDSCGETQWSSNLWYPACSLAQEADLSKFSDDVSVTMEDFNKLVQQVKCTESAGHRFQPSAGIGPVHAKLPKRNSDFFWCEGRPIISPKALQVLDGAGIKCITGPVIDLVKGLPTQYLAWQVPVVALYTDQMLKKLTLDQCPKCRCWNLQNLRTKLSGPREYVASRIPADIGLVRAEEGGETLATDLFIQAVRSAKLKGIEFKEWGTYV